MAIATVQVAPPKVRKATKVTVEQVKELTAVRAEITLLEARAKSLVAALELQFEKDDTAKVSVFDTLTHQGLEVARMLWRSRPGLDTKQLQEQFPEAFNACQKVTKYSTITTLFK